jgi:hypothetical protein
MIEHNILKKVKCFSVSFVTSVLGGYFPPYIDYFGHSMVIYQTPSLGTGQQLCCSGWWCVNLC